MNQQWKEQLEVHRIKRKEEIFKAAQKLFLERGLDTVKLNDIVNLCGISKVTFYKYFRSLDEIVFEVQMNILKRSYERYEEIPRLGSNGREKFGEFLRWMIPATDEDFATMRFLALFDAHYREQYPTPELETAYIETLKTGRSIYSDLLQEGMQDGSIRNDIDAATLQFSISNISSATIHRMMLRGKLLQYDQGVEPAKILEQMVNMVMTYLKPQQ
jgi:AcrR family transcriptional regulator